MILLMIWKLFNLNWNPAGLKHIHPHWELFSKRLKNLLHLLTNFSVSYFWSLKIFHWRIDDYYHKPMFTQPQPMPLVISTSDWCFWLLKKFLAVVSFQVKNSQWTHIIAALLDICFFRKLHFQWDIQPALISSQDLGHTSHFLFLSTSFYINGYIWHAYVSLF